MSFLIGGGCDKNTTDTNSSERVELIVNNTVVRQYVTKSCAERMSRHSWNVSEFINKTAQLRLVDESSERWGYINFDDFLMHYDHCRGVYRSVFSKYGNKRS